MEQRAGDRKPGELVAQTPVAPKPAEGGFLSAGSRDEHRPDAPGVPRCGAPSTGSVCFPTPPQLSNSPDCGLQTVDYRLLPPPEGVPANCAIAAFSSVATPKGSPEDPPKAQKWPLNKTLAFPALRTIIRKPYAG